MIIAVIFFCVLVVTAYKFLRPVSGDAFCVFVLSLIVCLFSFWFYFFYEVKDAEANLLSHLLFVVHWSSLPFFIITFLVTVISGVIMFALKESN